MKKDKKIKDKKLKEEMNLMDTPKRKEGCQTIVKWDNSYYELIPNMISDNLTFREITIQLGLSAGTIYRWVKEKPRLRKRIQKAKMTLYDRVESALVSRALGKQQIEETYEWKKKKLKLVKKVVSQLAPDVTACKHILKVKKPKEWPDRQDVNIGGNITFKHADHEGI
jgi:predicted DNA-binding transcriptional regulator AlpA